MYRGQASYQYAVRLTLLTVAQIEKLLFSLLREDQTCKHAFRVGSGLVTFKPGIQCLLLGICFKTTLFQNKISPFFTEQIWTLQALGRL